MRFYDFWDNISHGGWPIDYHGKSLDNLKLGGFGYIPLGSKSVMEKPSDFILITLEMGQLLDSTTGVALKAATSFTGKSKDLFYILLE